MAPTTTTTNGKPRKQLSDQLDRLDTIIDALAEGLNGAVADAAREGTRLAVKDAIIEIATNPELRALLAPAQPVTLPAVPPAPTVPVEVAPEPQPGLWARLKAKLSAARDAVNGATKKATDAVTAQAKAARDAVAAVAKATGEALSWRRVFWIAAGVGLTVGVMCLVMPHTAAAVVGAVASAATTVAVQTGSWLKRAARRFGLVK